MSDFLVALGSARPGVALLEVLRFPYGDQLREGLSFDFTWGSVAILREPVAATENVRESETGVFASVGDLLPSEVGQLAEGLLACAASVRGGWTDLEKASGTKPHLGI